MFRSYAVTAAFEGSFIRMRQMVDCAVFFVPLLLVFSEQLGRVDKTKP